MVFSYTLASAGAPSLLIDPDRITYKPLSFTPPRTERVTLDNGLVLYTLADHELPLVKITAVIRTGSMFDPPDKEGLAELTGKVMRTGGIMGMTGNDVDETLDSMAAILNASVNRDSGVFSLSVLRNDLEKGLDLFSRILMNPVFEAEKLSLAKELKIEELRRIADDPQKLAFREFGRLIHEGSLRGRLATTNSINRIQREDLIPFHRLFFQPRRVMISISGDIDQKEAETLVNRYFGNWQSSEEQATAPPTPQPKGGQVYVLPRKDLSQSTVIFGWPAPAKRSAQFFPMEVTDFIVGSGGFRSRLFQEIRTNRGLAYSTGSFYTARGDYGYFGAYALTKSESTLEVMSLLRGILREIGQKPLPPKELDMTKRSILNSFIFSFTSANQIALQQLMIEYENLPGDYLTTYLNHINAVSEEEVRTAAGQLDPEKAIILVVGNDAVCEEISASFKNVMKIETPL
jgi:zinc protease